MGNFEIEASAYPIGYLNNGVAIGYKVTDMRNLHSLHSQPISKDDAIRIAAAANNKIRAGSLSLKDGDTSVSDFVQAELESLN
jgi:hypothetical protein